MSPFFRHDSHFRLCVNRYLSLGIISVSAHTHHLTKGFFYSIFFKQKINVHTSAIAFKKGTTTCCWRKFFMAKKFKRQEGGWLIFWNEPLFSWRSGKVLAHFVRNGNFEKIERNFPHDNVSRVLQSDTIVITKFQSRRRWSHYSDIAIITLFHTSQIWRNLIWTFSMEKCFDGLFMEAVSDTCIAARTNQYS